MRLKRVLYVGLGILAIGAAGFGVWVLSLLSGPVAAAAPPVPSKDVVAMQLEYPR